MDTRTMREEVESAYRGRKWKSKAQKMSDAQIIAIYSSLQKRKKVKS